jgi:hypothetical protein
MPILSKPITILHKLGFKLIILFFLSLILVIQLYYDLFISPISFCSNNVTVKISPFL